MIHTQYDASLQGRIQHTGMQHEVGACELAPHGLRYPWDKPRGHGYAEPSQYLTLTYPQLLNPLQCRSIAHIQRTIVLITLGSRDLELTASLYGEQVHVRNDGLWLVGQAKKCCALTK